MNLEQILINWYKSYRSVENNSTELLKSEHQNNYQEVSDKCSEKMQNFFENEQNLYDIEISSNLPQPLIEHLEAEKDRGCITCWCSSVRRTIHADGTPSCNYKISRWFDTQKKLLDYIEKKNINHGK